MLDKPQYRFWNSQFLLRTSRFRNRGSILKHRLLFQSPGWRSPSSDSQWERFQFLKVLLRESSISQLERQIPVSESPSCSSRPRNRVPVLFCFGSPSCNSKFAVGQMFYLGKFCSPVGKVIVPFSECKFCIKRPNSVLAIIDLCFCPCSNRTGT